MAGAYAYIAAAPLGMVLFGADFIMDSNFALNKWATSTPLVSPQEFSFNPDILTTQAFTELASGEPQMLDCRLSRRSIV